MKLQNLKRINQDIKDLKNPLEHLKVASALNSELFKLDYRITNKPNDISPLDYTIIMALDRQIPKECTDIQEPVVKWGICPTCKGLPMQLGRPQRIFASQNYCQNCGQRILWKGEEE